VESEAWFSFAVTTNTSKFQPSEYWSEVEESVIVVITPDTVTPWQMSVLISFTDLFGGHVTCDGEWGPWRGEHATMCIAVIWLISLHSSNKSGETDISPATMVSEDAYQATQPEAREEEKLESQSSFLEGILDMLDVAEDGVGSQSRVMGKLSNEEEHDVEREWATAAGSPLARMTIVGREAVGLLTTAVELLEHPFVQKALLTLDTDISDVLLMWEPPWECEAMDHIDANVLGRVPQDTVVRWAEAFSDVVDKMVARAMVSAKKEGKCHSTNITS